MGISDDQSLPKSVNYDNADYWGWFDKDEKFTSFIFTQRFLLDMCFPYGIKITEESGSGKAYRLHIINAKNM